MICTCKYKYLLRMCRPLFFNMYIMYGCIFIVLCIAAVKDIILLIVVDKIRTSEKWKHDMIGQCCGYEQFLFKLLFSENNILSFRPHAVSREVKTILHRNFHQFEFANVRKKNLLFHKHNTNFWHPEHYYENISNFHSSFILLL